MKPRLLLLCFLILSVAVAPESYAARRFPPAPTHTSTTPARSLHPWKARLNGVAVRFVAKLARVLPIPAFDEPSDAPYNDLAVAALCCGIGGWIIFPLALPAAIILGALALGQIRETGERGKGMAIAAIVLGALPIALVLVLVVWLARY